MITIALGHLPRCRRATYAHPTSGISATGSKTPLNTHCWNILDFGHYILFTDIWYTVHVCWDTVFFVLLVQLTENQKNFGQATHLWLGQDMLRCRMRFLQFLILKPQLNWREVFGKKVFWLPSKIWMFTQFLHIPQLQKPSKNLMKSCGPCVPGLHPLHCSGRSCWSPLWAPQRHPVKGRQKEQVASRLNCTEVNSSSSHVQNTSSIQ